MSDYVQTLARFAQGIYAGEIGLPDAVGLRAKDVLLDSVGAILAARSLPEVSGLVRELGPAWGGLETVFLHGTAGVSLELDEGCAASRGHPGIHVVPVAVHVAGGCGASGQALLRALVAGYEVAARLGAATTFRPLIHPHGTWGACGGAAAAGLLMGLSEDRLAQAIRIAASLSVATHYQTVYAGATARNLWTGFGSLAGLLAAQAAAAGYTGAAESPSYVYGDTLGTGFDECVAVESLGERWYILGNYFKLYACCRHAHAAVDAFRTLVDTRKPGLDDIAAVNVLTYRRAVDAIGSKAPPRTPLAAKFSLPYMLGVYLKTGELGRSAFEPPHLGDARLGAFAARVSVVEEPAYTAMLPGHRVAKVQIRFADGSELSAEARGSRGDPADPLSAAEIEAKFHSLADELLGRDDASLLKMRIAVLQEQPEVGFLAAALSLAKQPALAEARNDMALSGAAG